MKELLSDVLGRLRLWQKLAILGWIAALLVAIPFYFFLTDQQQIIDAALQEEQGLEPAVKMLDVLRATAKHRGLSASVLAGKEALEADRRKQKDSVNAAISTFDGAYRGLDYPDVAANWAQFKTDWAKVEQGVETRTLNREQSWDAHSRLNSQVLKLIRAIRHGSALSLDSNPETYYLIQAVLANSPILGEKLGQARGFGASLLAKAETLRAQPQAEAGKPGAPTPPHSEKPATTPQERGEVLSMIERAHESLDDINQQIEDFKRDAPDDLRERLDGRIKDVNALVNKVIPLARTEIVDANVLAYSSTDYFALATKAIDAGFAFTDAGSDLLKELFKRKIDEARTKQYTISAAILAIFAIAALIAVFVSRSITGPVNHLVGVMDKLAMGDSTVRANLQTFDEVGLLGRQFDIMVDQREAASAKVQQENEQLNNSVIELLQAVARLAEKDLTVKVPVAEDITGLVADALNLLTQETSNVLNRVVDIAGNVARISRQVKSQSDTVIGVASEEKREVEQAAAELNLASEVMQDIAKLALSCNQAAEQAIQNTDKAQETVLGTVEGITTIRDTIRETEKRIKRLGERSQEIGGVVNIINGIAERTHILAINASMHAASAGEAGRGFAVVANEVQKLAENAREATLKISGLVNNIQLETADTVTTMNDAISQVVRGTTLAQQAGSEMRETRDTTANLVQLVRRIADSSKAQAQTSLQLRERALQIQKSTEHTYVQLQAQGVQTEQLVGFSEELVESVGVFTLPKLAGV